MCLRQVRGRGISNGCLQCKKAACAVFESAQDLGMPGGMLKHVEYSEPLEAFIGMFPCHLYGSE